MKDFTKKLNDILSADFNFRIQIRLANDRLRQWNKNKTKRQIKSFLRELWRELSIQYRFYTPGIRCTLCISETEKLSHDRNSSIISSVTWLHSLFDDVANWIMFFAEIVYPLTSLSRADDGIHMYLCCYKHRDILISSHTPTTQIRKFN